MKNLFIDTFVDKSLTNVIYDIIDDRFVEFVLERGKNGNSVLCYTNSKTEIVVTDVIIRYKNNFKKLHGLFLKAHMRLS